MCCQISQKTIRCYGILLCFGSFFLILASFAITLVALFLSNKEILKLMPFSDQTDGIFNANDIVIAFGLVLSGIVIVLALWGCTVTCMKTKCCLVPFALIMFAIMLVYCFLGSSLILYGTKGEEFVIDKCATLNAGNLDELSSLEKKLFGFVRDFDKQIY